MEWQEGLSSEIEFWESWHKTKGLCWQAEYLYRLDPLSEIQYHVGQHLRTGREEILDVGAGPLTLLGKTWRGKKLNITACDALGDVYQKMNHKYRIVPLVETITCKAEELEQFFGRESFDIVHGINAIDHCEDPFLAIQNMVAVMRPSGRVILRHEEYEGRNEDYLGLHQWDFYLRGRDFMISGKERVESVNFLLGKEYSVVSKVEEGYIESVIKKN